MTSAVGIVGSSPGTVSSPGGGASAPPIGAASSSAAVPIQNPRIIQDPTAGFITQYLSANGGMLVAQIPSVVTVAYLRFGLARDGTRVESDSAKSVAATA